MLRRLALAAAAAFAIAAAPADIVAVAPSGPTVPERLLRISVSFATPQGHGLADSPALLLEGGGAIAGAFVDPPLWSPDRRTLSLLLDPGRVKSGLIAHDAIGPVLRAGERVALRIDGAIVHRWRVVPGGCTVPDPATWRIDAPKAGSRDPLTLRLPGAIDALSRTLIAVADGAGNRIDGAARLADAERVWRFVPATPWPRATLRIVVHPQLESPCGDEPGEPFEHAAGQGLGSRRAALRREFTTR